MARFSSTPAAVPPPSTVATAARAAAPAEQPKPATATVPKPSTTAPRPAAAVAPKAAAPTTAAAKPASSQSARPATTLPPEYQTITSRNIFDSASPGPKPATTPSSYEDLGQSETVAPWEEGQSMPSEEEALRPYLERMSRVAELGRMRGVTLTPSGLVPSTAVAGDAPNPKGRPTPLPPMAPYVGEVLMRAPGYRGMDVPLVTAQKAEQIDAEYRAAVAAHEAGQADIKRKEADPYFPRSQFPELAKQQRERLARVATLAALRKEYGLTD